MKSRQIFLFIGLSTLLVGGVITIEVLTSSDSPKIANANTIDTLLVPENIVSVTQSPDTTIDSPIETAIAAIAEDAESLDFEQLNIDLSDAEFLVIDQVAGVADSITQSDSSESENISNDPIVIVAGSPNVTSSDVSSGGGGSSSGGGSAAPLSGGDSSSSVGMYVDTEGSISTAASNLALNKRYVLSPEPNYELCTDLPDATQLTDGKAYGSNWTTRTTVGWAWTRNNPEVIIDLGKDSLCEKVKVYTIGGGRSDVFLPSTILVSISSDGEVFQPCGYFHNYGIDETMNEKKPRTIEVPLKERIGRYVKVSFVVNGPFVFTDEIEVLGEYVTGSTKINDGNIADEQVIERKVLKRLARREECLRKLHALERALASSVEPNEDILTKEIGVYLSALSAIDIDSLLGTEILQLEDEIDSLRGLVLSRHHNRDFIVKVSNPDQMLLGAGFDFLGQADPVTLSIDCDNKRFAYGTVNVTNCKDESLLLSVDLTQLNDSSSNPVQQEVLFLRHAQYVYGKRVGDTADILMPCESPFVIKPGQTAQLWIDVDCQGLASGDYSSSLLLSADGNGESSEVPISIRTDGVASPVRELAVCQWAYIDIAPLSDIEASAVSDDLKSNYTNVAVIHPKELPLPQEDETISFARFDQVLADSDYASQYLLFLAFTESAKDSGKFGTWMTVQWKLRFAGWLRLMVEHLNAKGIGYSDFAMYPFDESLCDEFYELAVFIKSVDSNIRIFANSFGEGTSDFKRFKDLIDTWCMNIKYCKLNPSWLTKVKSYGKPVWVYATDGPGKANDPVDYYKDIIDFAEQKGLQGVGYWVYIDPDKNSVWHDYETETTSYSVIYLNRDSGVTDPSQQIIPSRRWRVWRQSLQNYMYNN